MGLPASLDHYGLYTFCRSVKYAAFFGFVLQVLLSEGNNPAIV